MAESPTKSTNCQEPEKPSPITIEIPLPLLATLEDVDHAFLGLCIEAGQQVLQAMMEQDRTALCGPAWKPEAGSSGRRAGSTQSPITLGGRRLRIRRPRVRSEAGEELALPSYEAAARRDPLDRHTWEAMAAGISTRRYRRSLGNLPASQSEGATSKSAVSRRFVALTEQKLAAWLAEPLDAIDLRVIWMDGIFFQDHCILVALGVDSDGKKHPLGIREGTTENASVARGLLRDLVERGLSTERALVFVIDGAKGLRTAIGETWGPRGLIQRCPVHKRRNVLGHLPENARPSVRRALDQAWNAKEASQAQRLLENLARSLETEHPGAAASLREGLADTLTLLRLGVRDALWKSLRSTNAIESVNEKIATYARRVKRWRGGKMILRWVGAAVLEAQMGFRRVKGYREMGVLVEALRRHEEGVHAQSVAA